MKADRAAVLLANDGDAPDPAVARTACDLARRLGAKLVVVHVAPPPGRTTDALPRAPIPAYSALATLVEQCASAGGLVARANLRFGGATEEILAEASEVGAGLVVIAARRRDPQRGEDGHDPGEVLARRAPCPVLIVRDAEPGQARARLTIAGTGTARPHRAGLQRAVAG